MALFIDKSPSDKSEGLILCAVEAMNASLDRGEILLDAKSGIIEMLLTKNDALPNRGDLCIANS